MLMMMIAPIICAVVEALGKLWMIVSTTHAKVDDFLLTLASFLQ
jgi:hypothetical protein